MTVLKLRRGDDFRRRVLWKGVGNAPLDLSGYTVTATISWSGGSVACLIDQAALATGQYDISLQEAESLTVPDGRLSKLMLRYVSPAGGTVTAYADVEGLTDDVLMPETSAIEVIVSDQGTIEIAAIGIPGPPGSGGGGGGGITNLSIANRGTSTLDITSDTGGDATIPAATGSLAGLMAAADKTKLDGVAAGATANATNAQLRDRSTHTGEQAIATVAGLQVALDGKEAAGAAVAALTAHLAAGDPHPQYTTAVEAAAASPVQSVAGRAGAVTLVKGDVGLGSVDNTSDASKPVSTATATALAGKADIGHGHTASEISDFAEAVDDEVASLLVAGANVTLTYNDATNTLTIAATGGGGGATGKQTIFIPAAAMVPRITNGPSDGVGETTTNRVMRRTMDYDASTAEFAQFAIAMPKSWNEGTITFQALWSHAATTVNFGVVWTLAAVSISDADALEAAFGTAVNVADTGGTTDTLYISPESSAVTIAGTPAELDQIVLQIARTPTDGADTMAIDARLHGVRVYYTTNAATDD
jgi:hypothetical protein